MAPRLVQTRKIAETNHAERQMLTNLKRLPSDATIIRELRVAFRESEKKPDFIVVSPKLALLVIEVKDWNLEANTYRWIDQSTVEKTDMRQGTTEHIRNPYEQARTYYHTLREVTKVTAISVTSIVAFPRQTRQRFLQHLGAGFEPNNRQTRFLIDLDLTLFKDDFDAHLEHLEELFLQIVRRTQGYHPATMGTVERTVRDLIPASFIIGDAKQRSEHQGQLQLLSDRQQDWVYGLARNAQTRDANYLLDVAGSGKTNALISKALYLLEQEQESIQQILITTYNDQLALNIKAILMAKLGESGGFAMQQKVTVSCLPEIIEQMVASFYYPGVAQPQLRQPHQSEKEYQVWLKHAVREILEAAPHQFARFDAVCIDEIQDFTDLDLAAIHAQCQTHRFFFVGDIGQKLYDRVHNLQRAGFVIQSIDLDRSYVMYRTPLLIGQLATRFLLNDSTIRYEFRQHGYEKEPEYRNQYHSVPQLLWAALPEKEVIARLQDYLQGPYTPDDIMIICPPTFFERMQQALDRDRIPWSTTYTQGAEVVHLVDFHHAKGLERRVVIILGIEELYHRSALRGRYDSSDVQAKQEQFSRRAIYMAMTRTIEDLLLIYSDPLNAYIADLLQVNKSLSQPPGGATRHADHK